MIYGLLVTKNETDRYLKYCLEWNGQFFDEIAVYDDRSDDGTAYVAERYAEVKIRPPEDPSFLDNESAFRSDAWRWMEEAFNPNESDWIVAFDADEFLISDIPLRVLCEKQTADALNIAIPEVFKFSPRPPRAYVRTDGYWGGLKQPRIVRYRKEWEFRPSELGCGSVPTYAYAYACEAPSVSLLHFGYARPGDQMAKYERYANRPGHNPTHIDSILTKPELKLWKGATPDLEGGRSGDNAVEGEF